MSLASSLTLEPIGFVRTPFSERSHTPRQPNAPGGDQPGVIELLPGRDFEHALSDVDDWEYLWVIFWFHRNKGWRPKVLPPRSTVRRGVFATRAPHRPNPIGMSVVKLESVEGLTIHIRNVDLLDGTPVLDLKPYVPWTDALAATGAGWLQVHAPAEPGAHSGPARDPVPPMPVLFASPASEQIAWLRERHRIDLETPLRRALALGSQPHPYRRIKAEGGSVSRIAYKDWRARFRVTASSIEVFEVFSGYRDSALEAPDPSLDPHRAFASEWTVSHAPR